MTNPNDPHVPADGPNSRPPAPDGQQSGRNTPASPTGNTPSSTPGSQQTGPNTSSSPTGNSDQPVPGSQQTAANPVPSENPASPTANSNPPTQGNQQSAPVQPTSKPTVRANLIRSLRKAAGYDDQLTPGQQITRRSFYSFGAFVLLGVAAWKSWFWLKDAGPSDGVQSPLRKGLNVNDKIWAPTLSKNHLAKTYPLSAASPHVRYNSGIGLAGTADPTAWRLQVTTLDNRQLSISLDDLRALPKTEFAFEFKCIEGWSQVSRWGGVRFSDFVRHYNLQKEVTLDYVGLTTPDEQYYVGIDTPSAMHPQTLLCYEMNGKPLEPRHGAPLRLIIPIKYGVKNLKKIGKIFFSTTRPRDYWFERGYDYYCGL